MKETIYITSPLGNIEIVGSEKGIISVSLNSINAPSKDIPFYLRDCVNQLNSYFKGELKEFYLIYDLQGTVFQKNVWKALQTIPFGETVSYQEIAKRIDNPKAIQAAGTAIGKNPCAITIPCHRVINKNGQLGGFAAGLDKKVLLLKHEGILS